MKLERLNSTTQHLSPESRERARLGQPENSLRVETMEGIEGDRQRSLQQELAAFDQKAVGTFDGGEQIKAAAHELASQLSALGNGTGNLVKAAIPRPPRRHIDAKA